MWCNVRKWINVVMVLGFFLFVFPSQVQAVKWVTPDPFEPGLGHVCQDGVELFAR
jgi:hypothetical protein